MADETAPSREAYKEKYVLFMDILGFSQKILDSKNDAGLKNEIDEILTLVYQSFGDYPRVGMRVTQFSDNIICSADRSAEGLAGIIHSAFLLTSNLILYDYLVRGGLAVGQIHHDSHFVYGPAVVEAHYLESCRAKQPIALVSKEVVEDAASYGNAYLDHLADDGPDRKFLHFLKPYCDYDPEFKAPGVAVLDRPAEAIVAFIGNRLVTTEGSPLRKAEWIADYWNTQVAPRGVFGRIEPKAIPEGVRKGLMTAIVRLPPPRRF